MPGTKSEIIRVYSDSEIVVAKYHLSMFGNVAKAVGPIEGEGALSTVSQFLRHSMRSGANGLDWSISL